MNVTLHASSENVLVLHNTTFTNRLAATAYLRKCQRMVQALWPEPLDPPGPMPEQNRTIEIIEADRPE